MAPLIRSLIDRALKPLLDRLDHLAGRSIENERQIELLRAALGRIEARQLSNGGPLSHHEFKAFSQWGEDGILDWLIRETSPIPHVFVEFGVEDYREAITRFLAEARIWTGLVMDGDGELIERVRRSEICWRQNIRATQAFVTRDNINSLISGAGITGELGLLAVDIDGNDWHIWQAIDVISPIIVVIEYNPRFGPDLSVTIPYDESFVRGARHPLSYSGASLKALVRLGKRKGYSFVGCESHGVNSFFIRRDRMTPALRELSPEEGYRAGSFTEARDERGLFVPTDAEAERAELLRLPLISVDEAGWLAGEGRERETEVPQMR